MSALYRAALETDLRPLSALLWQQRIPHRVAEEAGAQVLRLLNESDQPRAQDLLARWQRGELRVQVERVPRTTQLNVAATLRRAPVTCLLIALSVAGFLLIYLVGRPDWISALTFQPFARTRTGIVFTTAPGELWRLVTPVFLHFGWMHIVFNSLWCWELGKRIEGLLGSLNLAGLFLVIAIASNVAQHVWSGPVLFGGLSGVVYGFLGFAWVAARLNPRWRSMALATPIMVFMVGWLLICVTGVVEVLGFSIANAAHVAGLIAGALLGGVFALAYRH